MIEMTLSSRHRIRNSSPGGLRPSTLPLGHGGSPQYVVCHRNIGYCMPLNIIYVLLPAVQISLNMNVTKVLSSLLSCNYYWLNHVTVYYYFNNIQSGLRLQKLHMIRHRYLKIETCI